LLRIAAVVILLLAPIILVPQSAGAAQNPVKATQALPLPWNLALDGFAKGWNYTSSNPNPPITTVEGQNLTIDLHSRDGKTHRFFVDVDHSGLVQNCPPDQCSDLFGGSGPYETFPPSITYNFTIDFPAGTYTYYCQFHPSAMHGNFTVKPLLEPEFVRGKIFWTHHLSFSKNGDAQRWTARVSNPNNGVGLWVRVHVEGGSDAGATFTANSSTIHLGPLETRTNVTLAYQFSDPPTGVKFHFTATVVWGLGQSNPNRTTPSTQTRSFTIVS
jgi:hypothetical protein